MPGEPAPQVMACPGGCIGGGGQPKSSDPLVLLKRMGAGKGLDCRRQCRWRQWHRL